MRWIIDFQNRKIWLTDERLDHIIIDHPEMSEQIKNIIQTVENPEVVIRSKTDFEAELYYRHFSETPVGEKYLCAIVKGTGYDFFILTAYFTDSIKRGETLWIRK